ncbi:site-specific integrase [Flavobacterium sp.]
MNNIKILFVLDKSKSNSKGLAPLRCRLTYRGRRKPFTIGLFINPNNWNSKKQLVHPPNEENNITNSHLSLIKNKINQAFLMLKIQEKEFDVEDIYNIFLGESSKSNKSILQLFQEHNDKVEKLVGTDYALPTFWKFRQAKALLIEFIKNYFNKSDYLFDDLNLKFIQDYEFFLKTNKKLALATVNKTIQRFRKIVKVAISEDIIKSDPFILYKVTRAKKEIIFLTKEELFNLENYNFAQSRLNIVKDLFVFCCYTGLAYNEMSNLKKEHIIVGFDKMEWIQMKREKTDRLLSIPLLPNAKAIIDKYQLDDYLLPKLSNQKVNSYLKEISEIVGINKNLTHHVARKTFASTVLLYNDVPMEIVSELLGHSSITITQESYGKVVQKKISETMIELKNKLKSK